MSVDFVRGCYVTNWAVYRPEPYKFPPDAIPVGLCTHIFYAFAAINAATFEARMTDQWADEGLHGFQKVNDLKKKQPGLKTLLSFGGWTESQTGIYATMASSPSNRAAFIASAWALADRWGFDGIDMDWEYPDAASKGNFVTLMREIKAAGKGKMLTSAVSAGTPTIKAGYDVPALANIFDYITVMAYDFHGTWETVVGHQGSYTETEAALALWASSGMPKSKILMGIPAYGRGWQTFSCVLGASTTGPSAAQSITQTTGIASYFELMNMNGCIVQTPEGPLLEATINGAKTCFGFDDPAAVLKKMALVRSAGYGGAFSWTIDFDDKPNNFPIHQAIKSGLAGKGPIPSAPTPPTPSPTLPTPGPERRTSPSPTLPPSGGSCSLGQLRANANPAKYEECLFGNWIVRDCPPGTVFDPSTNNFKLP